MPARVSARSSSTTARRSSAQPSGRTGSVAPSVVPEEPVPPSTSPSLRRDVCTIFADSQRSTTVHRKLVVRLRKIQETCCGIVAKKGKTGKKGPDGQNEPEEYILPEEQTEAEKEFNVEISRCILRLVPIKKSEPVGDRVIRFLGLFVAHASEKETRIFAPADEDDTFPETPTARLIHHVISIMTPLLAAKDKTVRYRTTQIISHIINSVDSIDDELYHLIRQALLKRIRDKEPTVRVQAVLGLGRLAGNDAEEDDDDDGGAALLEKLIDILQNDTSAEVRKTLLLNLPLSASTLPYLLERARDLDAATRRALYARLLPTLGDFRHLSLSMREKLLRWGLRDRDDNVKKAAGKLFYERWIEDCAGKRNDAEQGGPVGQLSPPNLSALLELLERIDVINSGMEGGVAHEAMKSFWEGRPDYREEILFDEAFWDTLTAESAFLARSFNDFCRLENDGKYESLGDEKMPEVTALAYFLSKYTTALLEKIKNAKEMGEGNEEDTVENEFIVEQLLHIALTLDYSDEVGRRKMFSLLRETLAVADLPEECTKLTVEVLRAVCGPDAAGESEFCGVVLEAVAEVHDNIMTEDSFVSAKSELSDDASSRHRSETPDQPFDKEQAKAKILREIVINMKCLHIAQCMLQNVEGNLQKNMHLVTMLNNLVVPAVRSHEAPIRERGLECLGLCCLLDKTLAEENMILFIHCYSKGHEALQVTALQILSDMLTTHPTLLLPVAQPDGDTVSPPVFQKSLLKAFSRALKANSPASVQTSAATALSKLLLTNTFSPSGPNIPPAIKELNESAIETLLQSLVVSFFHPRTRENPALRQALAYFFPVYCHSRLANTEHMRRIAVPVVRAVLHAAEEYFSLEAEEDSDGDIDESLAEREVKALMTGVVGMLVEWTDERRVVGLGGERVLAGGAASSSACGFVHLALVKDILERVLGVSAGAPKCTREEKKLLFSIVSKVHIAPPSAPAASSRAGSRAGSRAPEGEDPFRSSTRSATTEIDADQAKLAEETKELLDEAIEENVAVDASSRNALVKVKNSVLKILTMRAMKEAERNTRERSATAETDFTDARQSVEPAGDIRPTTEMELSVIQEEEDDEESRETMIKVENEDA
ncbi:hypothetical protein DTO169E5_7310 [Paecilomyces variotii]|nr:hypothetical protein DTO169E5_7310 [Paecilomyces variotii]